jgi:purine-nucleoside phosphorylase
MDIYQKLLEATFFLKPFIVDTPTVAVVLGSGLGNFSKEIIIKK